MDETRARRPGLLHFCARPANLHRAVRTSLIVGPILTLINQFGVVAAVMHLQPVAMSGAIRVGLTFLVPFLVSLTSSAAADRERLSR